MIRPIGRDARLAGLTLADITHQRQATPSIYYS